MGIRGHLQGDAHEWDLIYGKPSNLHFADDALENF